MGITKEKTKAKAEALETALEVVDDKAKGKPKAVAGGSDEVTAALIKSKGEGVVIKGTQIPQVKRIPFGVFELDLATGGGVPRGRTTMIYGPESSGKTNSALKLGAYVQKYDPPECNRVVFADLENTLNTDWAATLGVDPDQLIVFRPGYGEEAVDGIEAYLRAPDVSMVIMDSLAVLTPIKEVQQSTETGLMGSPAFLTKRLANKIALALTDRARQNPHHLPTMIVLNQIRYKVGVVYGDPEVIPGGQAMKFLSSLTLRMSGKNLVDKNEHPDLPTYKSTKVIIKKAKIPVRAAEVEYDLAMQPTESLSVGESNSWNAVSGHLKIMAYLKKDKGSWVLFGESYDTLAPIYERYAVDEVFRLKCQKTVIEALDTKTMLVAAQGAANE